MSADPTVQPATIITAPAIDPEAIAAFIGETRGQVIQMGDAVYDEARRIQNGMIDRHPAMILRCAGTADVVAAVTFAREHRLPLSIKGGGHNVSGNAMNDGGLVIDLSAMRAVHVDPERRMVRAQGGATWGDVDREAQLFGLAVPGGVVSTTGIGGLTLHGGLGHIRRSHGLSLDSIVEIEIVTADGMVGTASETMHPDLFWAVRGAGSNFGVVTSFLFRAYPLGPMVQLCAPAYAMEDASTVLRGWRTYVEQAPDEVSSLALMWSVPDVDAFPVELRRRPVIIAAAVYDGPVADGERVMQPLRELGTPLLDLTHPEMFTELQSAFDPFFPKGGRYYWKSTYIDDLSDAALDTAAGLAAMRPSPKSALTFWHLGGAISRVEPTATAYYRRDAPYLLTAESTWDDPAEDAANMQWSRQSLAAMEGFSRGGLYLNFPGFGEEKEAMLRASFGPNYDRLVALKETYDPGNLFHMNLNIRPGAGQGNQ